LPDAPWSCPGILFSSGSGFFTWLRRFPDAFQFPLENNKRYEAELVVTPENIVTSVDGVERETQSIAGREFGVVQP